MSPRIEWPTLLVAVVLYTAFGLLTWWHTALAWPIVLMAGGYLVAWHGSLQHEVVHGHPTCWPWLNELMVLPNLWLWLPFRLYRASHLTHHSDEVLTDPRRDPESFYLTREAWQRRGALARGLRAALNTAPGRLLLGPPVVVAGVVRGAYRDLRDGTIDRRAWALHMLGVALVLGWTVGICDIALVEYLLLYVWPGISLTLLRSFAEHDARPASDQRTVAVETHPLLSLLYLNNNLHPAHHAEPGLAWYRLPQAWVARRDRARVESGYFSVLRRHLLRPRIDPVWPLESSDVTAPAEPPAVGHMQATRSR